MKIIINERGRAHQFLVPDEVRSIDGYYLPEAMRLLSDRYGFSQTPNIEDMRTTGGIFKDGRLVSGAKKINIGEIGIFNDSIYAIAQDTATADFIVDDLIAWSEQAVGLRPQITKIPRKYDNAVVVEFEADIEKRFDIFNELIRSYSDMLANLYNEAASVSICRIDFGFDPLEVKLSLNTRFTIERRVGSPFSSNRYFCVAPLKTEMHVALLEQFEQALDADLDDLNPPIETA